VEDLLAFARAERGHDTVNESLRNGLPDLGLAVIRSNFTDWGASTKLDRLALREAIANVAAKKKWFKDERIGRGLAPMVWGITIDNPDSPLARTLSKTEAWLYG